MKSLEEIKILINEAKTETKSNPSVYEWEDAKKKVLQGHVFLNLAAELHKFNPKDVLKSKGFYKGELVKMKTDWSTLDGYVWIQISDHSKYKETT